MSGFPRTKAASVTAWVFLACGWLLSGWLLLRGLSLGMQISWGETSPQIACSGCDQVLASSSSWLLGFPIAGWGIVYFALLGCLLTLQTLWSYQTAMVFAAVGSGISLVLSAALLFSGPPVCRICLLVHACNVLLFVAVYALVRTSSGSDVAKTFTFWRSQAAIVTCAVLAGATIQGAILKPVDDVQRALKEYNSGHPFNIPILRDDPVLGFLNAPVRLVVFSSFQCPACRGFAGIAHGLNRKFPSRLQIVFKNYPLGKGCNPDLVREMQPRACAAAYAAEAANRQGEFWPYHDGIFLHSSLMATEPELERIARSSGLDIAKWDLDRRSRAIETRVKLDIGLGHLLGIDGTPSIFLNGRRVPATSVPILEVLIEQEVKRASAAT
jgi:protein-disulfide isomerase